MYLPAKTNIEEVAKNIGFSIFVGDFSEELSLFDKKSTFFLAPDEKTGKISIDSVREFLSLTTSRQTTDIFLIIISPEVMSEESSNCLLKSLEEPSEHYHFLFFTKNPSALLPTIRSRAYIFEKITKNPLDSPVDFDEKVKSYAKKLISIKEKDLPSLAKEIADKKDRNFAKNIVAAAIEISVKSFFKTKNPAFLKKLENMTVLYKNLDGNGHIKLHFVADML